MGDRSQSAIHHLRTTLARGLVVAALLWVAGMAAFPEQLQIVAHRGASSVAPENTLAAAAAALKLGADMWEFDVRQTRDGVLVLLHDHTLTRTTDARTVYPRRSPWRVADFTLEEIALLDAGSWFVRSDPFGVLSSGELSAAQAESYIGEPVPTLREALLWSREHGLKANIELKAGLTLLGLSAAQRSMAEATVALIRELGMESSVLVTSFQTRVIAYVKQIAPEIPAGPILLSLPRDPLASLEQMGADAVALRWTAFRVDACRALTEAGIQVFLWTVNAPDDMARFLDEPGVTGLITDWPQQLRKLRDGVE